MARPSICLSALEGIPPSGLVTIRCAPRRGDARDGRPAVDGDILVVAQKVVSKAEDGSSISRAWSRQRARARWPKPSARIRGWWR